MTHAQSSNNRIESGLVGGASAVTSNECGLTDLLIHHQLKSSPCDLKLPSPPPREAFLGINDEVDAASGARHDCGGDIDGDDGDAGAVRRKPHYFTPLI